MLALAVRHRLRSRALRCTQDQVQRTTRNNRDRSGALLEPEPELAWVEVDRAIEISDLVAHDRVIDARRPPYVWHDPRIPAAASAETDSFQPEVDELRVACHVQAGDGATAVDRRQ